MSVTTLAPPIALPPEMLAEVERIRAAGVLGASGRLLELFEYLVGRSGDERPPKEAEIAFAVFGKADAEAVRDDPVARVYIHRLRKRLDDYYLRNGEASGVRLDIPKGDYRLVCVKSEEAEAAAVETVPPVEAARPEAARRNRRWGLIAAGVAAAIAANVGAWAIFLNKPAKTDALIDTPMWTQFAHSQRPLTIVVGDYYMFGEYDQGVYLKRLIRDFSINSKEDLVHHYRNDPKNFDVYSDVAMQYLPASVAFALTDLAPLMQGRDVQVSLASELSPDRLKTDDILFVGMLSAMGKLRDPAFAQSHFGFGESFDQIVDRSTGKKYTSEALVAAPSDAMYRDYGFFSTFTGPGGNRISILSGSRDTAVMGVAEAMTHLEPLGRVEKQTEGVKDFEAVFEVKGQKHVNLEAQILVSYELDSKAIWTGAPANVTSFPTK